MIKKSIIFISVFFFVNLLIAGQMKYCPKCSSSYPSEYFYCPIDGEKLITKATETKEIDGFQNYKWGISTEEAKTIAKDLTFEIDNSKPDIVVLTANNFEFQSNDCLLKLEFYKDKFYKASIHFVTEDNQASINDYFSRVELIKEIYGETKKIAIGRESDDYDHRVTQISIGNLTYQHKWNTILGNLAYQIASGSYGRFVHSFFYSSKDADKIDSEKSKSEF